MLNLSYGKRCSDLQDESRDKWEEWVNVLRRLDCGKTLAPWKKNYDQPRQHIKKQRHYFANIGLSSQGYGLSCGHVWMWELDCEESWVPKNWCFWTVVLEKTLENPLDCKEIQPVHSKGDHPGCSLEGMIVKLKLQYFGHLMQRVDSLEKTLMVGGIGGRRKRDDRGWDGWMASPTWWTWVWANSGSWWCTGRLGVLRFMGSQKVGQDWVTEGNWTEHNNLSAAHDQAVILIFRYYFLRNTFCKFIAAF